jgi:phosphatidylserine/phosphatidylglycerophosphate/cardiolipin synthase-like enzyme
MELSFPPRFGDPFMTWVLLATGFTGALTLLFLVRLVYRRFALTPSIAVYHSPKGGCTDAVVRELRGARREVLVLAYSFTSKPIAQALVEAKKRGAHVEIILDRSNEHEEYSELAFLIEQGLAPYLDAHHAIAHNKVMVIDRHTVVTGSFNFTHQAEAENAENLLILKGHADLSTLYRQNFLLHKQHSQVAGKPAAHAPQHKAA